MSFGFHVSPPIFSESLAVEHITGLGFDPTRRFQRGCAALSSLNVTMTMTFLLSVSGKSLDYVPIWLKIIFPFKYFLTLGLNSSLFIQQIFLIYVLCASYI